MGPVGDAFADEVRHARAEGLPIVMSHEADPQRHGCDFSTFFRSTPQDLIGSGLYKELAIAFVSGEGHRDVSRKILAKALGAVEDRTGMIAAAASAALGAVDSSRNHLESALGAASSCERRVRWPRG